MLACRPLSHGPELAGGIAILAGFYTQLVSLAVLPLLLGAVSVHAPNGWVFNAPNGGWEYPAFLAAAALVQVLVGDGNFAIRPWSLASEAPAKFAARAAR
jgi:putative oxidoreductase